jgi:hypothetical protein
MGEARGRPGDEDRGHMFEEALVTPLFAADYPFLDVLWTLVIFMAFLLWIWLAITCFGDIFRRHDMSGILKALWVVLIILMPYLGVLVYLIAYHGGIAQRDAAQMQQAQEAFDARVREAAASSGGGAGGGGGAASEIAEAHRLLESGAINQEEFERLKSKALAG